MAKPPYTNMIKSSYSEYAERLIARAKKAKPVIDTAEEHIKRNKMLYGMSAAAVGGAAIGASITGGVKKEGALASLGFKKKD